MILVTGASGFVGRQVVRSLLSRGYMLRLVQRARLANSERHDHAEIVECPDVFAATSEWWHEVLRGVQTVVHLAWYTEPGTYLQSKRNLDCLTGTVALARACVDAGVRRFIGIGTCAECDLSQGPVRPDTPLKPLTLYAACKSAVFEVLSQYLPAAGIQFAWCRLFYLYGEGEDPRRFVPYLRRRLAAGEHADLTSGKQIRDFLDVRVAGDLIARAAVGEDQGAINICSGVPITIRQLAENIADTYGRRDLLRFGARPENLFDPPYVVGLPVPADL